MKTNELRIGNLVKANHRGISFICDVVKVFFNEISVKGIMDDYKCERKFSGDPEKYAGKENGFEPIPLTEEWMMRFGFEKIPYMQILFLGEIRDLKEKECWYQIKVISEFTELEIAIHFEHDTTITIIIDDHTEVQYIKHVHQLQNLYFALTGEELTIKT